MEYLLSRHPIYRSKIDVAAYEIRSRPILEKAAGETAPSDAERAVLSMFTTDGLDQIVGAHPCFINLTPETLAEGLWKEVPGSRVIFGYLNDFGPSDDVAKHLVQLVDSGARVALSDRLNPESLGLLGDRAYAIKMDVTDYAPDELKDRFHELKRFKASILAGRVDTYDDLEYCKTLGFDLYQGHFISRAAGERKDVPVNRMSMMRLMAKLQDPDLAMTELEKMISLDVALSLKLLNYANSAAIALPRNVTSVGHAARMIGLDMLRRWTTVLLLSTVDDKPRELMTISLVRARMCERLAEALKNREKESFLTAGLLSVVDALLDCPMEKAIADLPLVDEVKSALISRAGAIGQALRCTLAYERADWDDVQFYGLPPAQIRDIYMESLAWARQMSTGLLTP